MGPNALKYILNVARKSLVKDQGSGIMKVPGRMDAEAKASEIVTRLTNAGLDLGKMDDFIRSEADVAKYLNILDSYKENQIRAQARIRDKAAEKAIKEGIAIPADSPRGKEITEQLFGKRGTVVDMKGNVIPEGSGIMGGESIESLMKSGDVTKGTVTKKSKKVQDREMFKAANERLTSDVDSIIKNIKSMEPITAMKEANSVIARKGKYKNLTPEQSKKILQDTEDHIFERYPVEDPEDFAAGGRAGFFLGGNLGGGYSESRKDSGGKQTNVSFGGGGGGNNNPPPVVKAPPPKPKRKVKKNISTGSFTPTFNFIKKFIAHDNYTDQLKASQKPNYHQMGGLDFMARFPDTDPDVAKGLASAYQNLFEYGRAVADGPGGITFDDAGKKATEESRLNAVGIDAYANPDSSLYQDYFNQDPLTGAVPFNNQSMADGGRAGFFMGSRPAVQKGLSTLKEMLKYFGKKSDTVKNPSDILKIVNPKRLNKILEDPNIYRKFDVEKGIAAPDLIKNMQKQMMDDRQKTIGEMLGAARNIKSADDNIIKYKNEMIEDMLKKGVDREMAEEMAETISKMAKGSAGKFDDTPKLTDEGIMQLENILKDMETGGKTARELNATGGRIGYKDGPKMNRRTFMKYLAGFASLPIIGKIVKPLKTVKGVKNVPIIKTGDVPGKPEWFDALVNKVILEGDDVTKKFSTTERQVVYSKKIDADNEVTVYRDLDTDSVRVDYSSPNVMLDEPVSLSYTKGQADEATQGMKPADEFETFEQGLAARSNGPDDYSIDPEPMVGNKISDLETDVSKLKEYATGKGPTMKEFVASKKRKDRVKKINEGDIGEISDYATKKQGDYYDYDDYASGGIARMLGE